MSDTDDLSIFEVTQEDLADFKIGSESTDDDHTKKDSKNKEEERSKSVSRENSPLKFNFQVYKSVAKPLEGVPKEEKDIHNSMGISLAPIGDVIPGWYNAGGGNKFFMNEVNAHMKLPVCHQSMYILAQARAASYKNNVNSGKNYAPKSLAKDVGVAFECHVNTIAAQHKLPPVRITKKEQCVALYNKYLRGFSTYTKINMQLSRVACRFAISRLGLDPSTGMWCTDTDAIRSVTISEYSTTIISPSNLSAPDPKNILLSGMLLEWLEAHGYKVEADPKEIDYNKWSDLNAKNYIAHLKPKLEIQKGKTTSSRSRYSLSAACIQDTNAQEIPTDKPHHSTHYLVENRKPRIKKPAKS